LTSGYNSLAFDITALLQSHQDETLRLRFADVDNVNFFNLGVDGVGIHTPTSVPEVVWQGVSVPLALLLILGHAGWRRRQGVVGC
jgi:hypothetical protein